MNTSELETFFTQNPVPTGPEYSHGFLEIIGKHAHENTWSRLYAHFLEDLNNDGRYPFLEALCSIIARKSQGRSPEFKSHTVKTEHITSTGRVDIVIKDDHTGHLILIENKVYHHLNNDLEEYWNFFPTESEKKWGIVLSLKPVTIPAHLEGKFVSITHLEWVTEVWNHLLPERMHSKQSVYLDDFLKTIINMSINQEFNEQARFYFQHANSIKDALKSKEAAEQFVQHHYELIAAELGMKTFGNEITWKNIWDEDNGLDIYLTIVTEELLKGNSSVKIVIELIREPQKRSAEFHDLLKETPQYQAMQPGNEGDKNYLHFVCRTYDNLSLDDISKLSEFVVNKIKQDFGQTFVQMVEYFYPKEDISAWKRKVLP